MDDIRKTALSGTQENTYHQSISVSFDYPVCFTHDLFSPENPLLAEILNRRGENRKHRAAVYIDAGVAAAHMGLDNRIRRYFETHSASAELAGAPVTVPGGEAAKDDRELLWKLIQDVSDLHLDRQSYVIAVGGGAVLDMVGFATAIAHRGLRLIRVPTTTLAQNDAGVGVKNGINAQGQKNFVGTFAPPFAVLSDYEFLKTLPADQWISGVAEAFKVALIKDARFFEYLRHHGPELRARSQSVMEETVYRCAILHLDHIRTSGDPFEFGSARPLDFGHWAAHRLESMSGHRIGHGHAVAIGISIDAYVAMTCGLISETDLTHILDGVTACGLSVWDNLLERRHPDGQPEILDGLAQFREHLGGRLTITLPDGIGRKVEVHEVDHRAVGQGIEFLRIKHAQG
ncbi:3-dehydroquinate synthase [Desulfonema ishimotonii]|uniref:3-dehydroquinate synthase n=1 Tax=Desulfonema ishimotonii TaxID=45657 RepID=A0A401FQG6_9BACT|nr:3-dehydroquinate synthase [Desulfonema ishimotonii]GBC59105.1 3-dehydroquinate synthase [Desulfonema ishimotonii]